MTQPKLHPWLNTPEALAAANKAVSVPMALLGGKARIIGHDELISEALIILTECALPPRNQQRTLCFRCDKPLDQVRPGAKFCSSTCRNNQASDVKRGKATPLPARTGAHVGSMWGWAPEDRSKYAVREVGYVLCNYLRGRTDTFEMPASDIFAMEGELSSRNYVEHVTDAMGRATDQTEDDPRDIIEAYLESKGIRVAGDESLEELAEAAMSARKMVSA